MIKNFILALLLVRFRRSGDPYLLLRAVLPRESVLLDPAMQVHVRFRLGGPRRAVQDADEGQVKRQERHRLLDLLEKDRVPLQT